MTASSDKTVLEQIKKKEACLWINPNYQSSKTVLEKLPLKRADILTTEERLERFRPLLIKLFPELTVCGGILESELIPLPNLQKDFFKSKNEIGQLMLKADNNLPIAGSIKARGGFHEVLEFAEKLALEHKLINKDSNYVVLAEPKARSLFEKYTIAVGSTGNLGMSIGMIAAALGFKAVVHMSADAKAWKKDRLRKNGVAVIEYAGDYAEAVAAGRQEAAKDLFTHFVDDERSISLFLGYSVAALRLEKQLAKANIEVSENRPLFVYLPCGVGGAPGGITFGLKHVFGDNVHCFFAEPVASPCVLLALLQPDRPGISVYDIGLDNRTEADGLAVGKASKHVIEMMKNLLDGVFTVSDDDLFRQLYKLETLEGFQIEPSAAAGFNGPTLILETKIGQNYLQEKNLTRVMDKSTHILWSTGGLFVPEQEYKKFWERGKSLNSK